MSAPNPFAGVYGTGAPQAPQGGAAPGGNPFSGVFDPAESGAANAAAVASRAAFDPTSPDQASTASSLAPKVGVPPGVVQNAIPHFQAQADAQDTHNALSQAPATAAWAASNPTGAAAAKDDFAHLGVIEKTISALKTGVSGAINEDRLGRAYWDKQLANSTGIQTPQTDQDISRYEALQRTLPSFPGAYGELQKVGGFAGGLLDNVLHAAPEMAAGAGVGAIEGGVGAVPGAAIGFGMGWKLDAARVAGGLAYRRALTLRDRNGKPLSEPARVAAAVTAEMATYALMNVGGNAANEAGTELASHWTAEATVRALQRPTVARAVGALTAGTLKAGLMGGALNAGLEGSNILAQEIAKHLSGGNWNTLLNDPQTREDALGKLSDAAEQGFLLFGALGGLHRMGGFTGDMLRARQAHIDAGNLQALAEGSGASKLRGRSAAAFRDLVGSQLDGTPVENLYISAQAVQRLYQQANIRPGPGDALLGKFVPDIGQQMEQAGAVNGDVVVPTADFAAHLAGTDAGNALIPDARVRPDGWSLNERNQYEQAVREQLGSAQEVAGQPTGQDRVYQDVYDQLTAAGRPRASSRVLAALYAARASVRGQRLGIDPWDAYLRSGLEIRAADDSGSNAPRGTLTPREEAQAAQSGAPRVSDVDVPGFGPVKFNQDYDVGLAGGSSQDGSTVYLDRNIDRYATINGQMRDRAIPLAIHELTERKLEDEGQSYTDAHNAAEHAENEYVQQKWGISPQEYEHSWKPDIASAAAKAARGEAKTPPDIVEKPYEHPHNERAQRMLEEVKRYSQTAYHGTPHAFDKFSTEHIGSGEGHNAFGWGLYFAGNREVAQHYRNALRAYEATLPSGERIEVKPGTPEDMALAHLEDAVENRSSNPYGRAATALRQAIGADGAGLSPGTARAAVLRDQARRAMDVLEKWEGKRVRVQKGAGHLYTVDLQPGEHEYLDWDKPIAEQSPGVLQKLRESGEKPESRHAWRGDIRTGRDYYQALASRMREKLEGSGIPEKDAAADAQRAASQYLASIGIPGLKYLDGGSRAKSDGLHNYVIFDQQHVRIQHYEQSALGAGDTPQVAAPSADVPGSERPYDDDVSGTAEGFPEGSPLAQGVSGTERGAITFGHGKAIMELFKSADLSTVLHESGHLWLNEMLEDAQDPKAPQQIRDDVQTILQYLGVEKPEQIGIEQHEKFARAAEAYFMEGKAPSDALRGPFQRFRQWLTHIYRTVASLNAPVSPELRGVFERMLASDDEIAAARAASGISSDAAARGFRDRISGMMSKSEQEAYARAMNAADAEAHERLLKKAMAEVRAERTQEYRAAKERITDAVTKEVDERPVIQAMQFAPRMDAAKVARLYGNDQIRHFLAPQLLSQRGGTDPQHVAEMFGFRSGDDLIRSLVDLHQEKLRNDAATGKTLPARTHIINQEVAQQLGQKFGDTMDENSMREEALEAVHNAEQARVIATELRIVARYAGQAGIPLDMAQDWAQRTIASKRVDELGSVYRYARAEAQAAKLAERALLADKPQEAYLHKRQQLLNHSLYREAVSARDEITKGRKLFKRFGSEAAPATLSQEYVDRIHSLLARFDVPVKRDPDELARGLGEETLEGFVARKHANGYDLAVDPSLFGDAHGNVDRLTMTQFRSLTDAIRSLAAAGRDEETIHVAGESMSKEAAVAQMVAHLDAMPVRKPSGWYRPERAGALAKMKARTLHFMRAGDASLLKTEQMFDWMDMNSPEGPFNRYVFRPLKEAQLRADDVRRRVAGQIQDLISARPDGWEKSLDDEIPNQQLIEPDTGEPMRLTRKEMLAMALNLGTEDNATKLAAGWGWDENATRQWVAEHMTRPDWDFVEGVWKIVGQFRDDIDALQRRVSGVGIKFVQGRPLATPFGQIAGQYFPLVYDAERSPEAERHLAKAAADMFENNYYRATTPTGHTRARIAGVKRPVSLSLDVIPWKIGQVIHDLNYREPVMQAGKLLGDRRVQAGITKALGHEYTQAMRPWLQSIANSRNINDDAVSSISGILRWARTNATYVGIGFRISTMAKHSITALSNSVGELGWKWMGSGLRDTFGTPRQMKETYDFVLGKSGEMRNRIDHYDRDIRQNLQHLLGEHGLKEQVQRFSTYGVGYLDMASAIPTWLGAYRKALSEGSNDDDAVYKADKMVRKAHGSQGLVDMPQIQRGGEMQKLVTMFYGFFNHVYNRQRDVLHNARLMGGKIAEGDYAGAKRDFPLIMGRTLAYLAVPALVEALYTQRMPGAKNKESWGGWAARAITAEAFAGIPVLRDMATAALEGYDYEFSPIERAFSTLKGSITHDLPAAVTDGRVKPSSHWLEHAIDSAGYATGWPTGQVGTSSQFLWDVYHGQAHPQSIADWYRGLSYGTGERERKAP